MNREQSPDMSEQVESEMLKQQFEEDFAKRETLEINGEQVEVLDISPPELKHEAAILMISGYGDGAPEGRKTNVFELYKQGRRVIMVKSPHGVKSVETENGTDEPASKENKEQVKIGESLMAQVNAIAPVLEQKNIPHLSIIGESRGGAVATLAAYLYPEKFENIAIVDPVGMSDAMSVLTLIRRFMTTVVVEGKAAGKRKKAGEVSEMAEEQMKVGTGAFFKWLLKTPITNAQEGNDMAKAELYKLLKDIKEHDIGISLIHGVEDPVFPMAEIQKNISNEVAQHGLENVIDGFYSVDGAHGDFNTRPELYTRVAEQAISALEKKAEKKSE